MKRQIGAGFFALCALMAGLAHGQTDGSATFRVTTLPTNQSYDPKNCMAIWVTDAQGRFVKTLKKQAASREGYLYQWIASSQRNTTDAITGATLSSHQTHAVTWNCRNASGALVADGEYRIMAEMTTRNGQGPVTPAGHVSFIKGPTPQTVTPANLANFSNFSLVFTPLQVTLHDIAVTALTCPTDIVAGAVVEVTVTILNRQSATESFAVVLSNVTQGVEIGNRSVAGLLGQRTTNVVFTWNTAGLPAGTYTLRALAGPVAGETSTADNVRSASVTLSGQVRDAAVGDVAAPNEGAVGDVLPVDVTVRNAGTRTESFQVQLLDGSQLLAARAVDALAAGKGFQLPLYWNTRGAAVGVHQLTVSIPPFTGETVTTNNARTVAARLLAPSLSVDPVEAVASLGGHCAAAAALPNSVVAVGFGAALNCLDVSAPATPRLLGSVRLPGTIQAIAVSGSIVFTANGSSGAHIVDAAAPGAPRHVGTFDTSGHACGVAVSGALLLIADGSAGLRILDVSQPASPTPIATLRLEGPARAIAVAGAMAYVLDSHRGLVSVDLAQPSAPRERAVLNVEFGEALALSGTTAYVVDRGGQLLIADVSNPDLPARLGQFTLAGSAGRGVALLGTTATVAVGAAGLQLVDVRVPTSPLAVALHDTPGECLGVCVSGSRAFVADGPGGLRVVNMANPALPVLLGEYRGGNRAVDVAVSAGKAYVAAGESGVYVYDTTTLAQPVLAGVAPGVSNARSVAVSGSLAVVADGQYGFKVLGVADPSHPTLVGTYVPGDMGALRGVALSGTTALAADGYRVVRLDLANPAAPRLAGSYAVTGGYVYDLKISGQMAVAAAGKAGVLIFSLAGGGLTRVGQYDTAGLALGVEWDGTRVRVADGSAGWLTLDLANPAAPALVSSFGGAAAADVAVSGTTVLVGDGGARVLPFDGRLLTPVPSNAVGPLVHAFRVTASGGSVFVAEEAAGLAVFATASNMAEPLSLNPMPADWARQIADADPNDALQSAADVAPDGDFDRDGLLNYQEYLAGTDPTDAASSFVVSCVAPQAVPGAGFVVRWTSVVGKRYTIHRSTDLTAGFAPLVEGILATPPVNTYTDTVSAGAGFYMVETSGP